ncbi:Lrp/AsnC family transcriptional regulator, partial [Streptomyces sp. MBT72]|uniref:Lrp/AsnC family transcriptional regulator n=1 Tax=Streptomyces sp. MBT72 TaxID=1488402 RepID=UPI001F198F33
RRGLPSPDELDTRLCMLLAEDCRQPAARLAERTGVSASTVRRRLERMHREDALVYRCEVARYLSGWPVSVTMWGIAPPGETARIASQLIGLREMRLCASLSGPYNLLLTVWLRSAECRSRVLIRPSSKVKNSANVTGPPGIVAEYSTAEPDAS